MYTVIADVPEPQDGSSLTLWLHNGKLSTEMLGSGGEREGEREEEKEEEKEETKKKKRDNQ